MTGGGFIYTNRESISLGIVVSIEQMARRTDGLESWQLLDDFKELPQIRPLLAGSTLVEYSAHAIAEGGIAQVPRLWGDGYVMVGDAAGLSLNALLTVRGMDFAVASGYYAAQTVVAAKKQKDFSGASLSTYEQRMRQSFVLRDLLSSKGIPQALENERLVTHYPGALANLLSGLYTIGPGPDVKLSRKVAAAARRHFLDPATLKDLWSLRKL
jgi:electron transfer flavoprotein-quinone oxidoreductase